MPGSAAARIKLSLYFHSISGAGLIPACFAMCKDDWFQDIEDILEMGTPAPNEAQSGPGIT